MDSITELYVSVSMALHGAADRLRAEDGQTSVEWIGISAVVVGIIAVFLKSADDIGAKLVELIDGLLTEAGETSTS